MAQRKPAQPRHRAGPLYRSAEGEASLRALYASALASLPFPHEETLVQTPSFGSVHVLKCGPPDAVPLVLWHGMAAPGPFLLPGFEPLVARFRVYVPDLPCQAGGRSEDLVLDPAEHDYGQWCAEVLRSLGLLQVGALPPLHMGVSLGGAALLDLAVVEPQAIRAAALVMPGSLHPSGGSAWYKLAARGPFLLAVTLYRLLPCRWTAWLACCTLCDEPLSADPLMENVRLAFRYVCYFPDPPLTLTDQQLSGSQPRSS